MPETKYTAIPPEAEPCITIARSHRIILEFAGGTRVNDKLMSALSPAGTPIHHSSKVLVQIVTEEMNRAGSQSAAFDDFGYLRLICSEIDMDNHGMFESFFKAENLAELLSNDGFFQELDAPEEAMRLSQMGPLRSYLNGIVGSGMPGDYITGLGTKEARLNDNWVKLAKFLYITTNGFSNARKTIAVSAHQGTNSIILTVALASGNCTPSDYGTVGRAVQGMIPHFQWGEPDLSDLYEEDSDITRIYEDPKFLTYTGKIMLRYIELADEL